jgi:hypothetical protein
MLRAPPPGHQLQKCTVVLRRHLDVKVSYAELQHIATADECIRIIDDPGLLTPPELDASGNPLGPTVDQKLKHAVARVQHRQWKLEKRSPDYVPKSVSVTKNIYQDVRDADTPEEAMKRYAAILDLRPDE